MFGYKVYINHFLWRMGLRSTLPRDIINLVTIKENGEKLIRLDGPGFVLALPKGGKNLFRLRAGAARRLQQAQKKLPPGVFFKIYSAWRSEAEQTHLREAALIKLKKRYPGKSAAELNRLVGKQVAAAGISGHQTGGAVDIGLCNAQGVDLDMGGTYLRFDSKTPTRACTTPHRQMLKRAMTGAGFINYPREWWHYSFGDQMWAAYSKKKTCFYGPILSCK